MLLFLHLRFYLLRVSLYSVPEQLEPTGSPEDWMEWFLYRLRQEPWALGGIVVIGLFVLTTLSLFIFALLFGCCGPKEKKQKKKQKKDGVI